MSEKDDVKGMKSMLDRQTIHPSTTWWGGWSALHYAISYGNFSVCKYLLSRNADPLLEDGDNQQSALEYAWTKILGKAFPPQRLLEFESIFNDRTCLEELGFPKIHKIVLGLHGASLSTELSSLNNAPEINATDYEGRTALSWAAQRGDLEMVTLLLARGVDPDLSNRARTTPLHYAVQAQNPSCIIPLLRHAAEVNATDNRLHTPLHQACNSFDDLRYIRPLVERGADVNAATDYEFFPLTMAAHRNHYRVAGYLLDHGADLNRLGQCRRSALFFAIEYNGHDAVELLLARGADCTGPGSDAEPTPLHFAARFADTRTLQILAEGVRGKFCLEELEAEDADGFVLEELLRKRIRDGGEGVDLGFEEAFQRLLDRVAPPREADREGDEKEVWEDAVETVEDIDNLKIMSQKTQQTSLI